MLNGTTCMRKSLPCKGLRDSIGGDTSVKRTRIRSNVSWWTLISPFESRLVHTQWGAQTSSPLNQTMITSHPPLNPDFEEFRRLAKGVDFVPVYRRLIADAVTPVSVLKQIDDGGSVFLFESVVGGERIGRYSFLSFAPVLAISAIQNHVSLEQDGKSKTWESQNPLDDLRSQVQAVKVARIADLHPFCGGAVGYAGYDVVRYIEELPNAPPDRRNLPDLWFGLFDQVIYFDNVNKTLTVVVLAAVSGKPIGAKGALNSISNDTELRQAYTQAHDRINEVVCKLSASNKLPLPADIDTRGEPNLACVSNFVREKFHAAVRKCVEYIRAGDIFQVVFSQRLSTPRRSDPFEIYRTLRIVNPSPFMFFLRTPKATLVGSSPEILCRVQQGKVTVRPLAGTRRRGATEEADQALAAELLADPKERAEHVMLVDLGRNDVGRVARFGSVKLSDVMVIERYSHVMHITSNVTGDLADGQDCFSALEACLPAGTVSGAPKVRAMQIIDEIEPDRRGPYAGAVGYIDYHGDMDTCIALRTLVVHGDRIDIQVGAGIVADSDPEEEYQETLSKARGLLKAIEITNLRCDQ
jgi:anthranilate synthase component 1